MKKAIVIGATSGIGKELAKVLARNNYEVGLVGRRTELLKKLKNEIPTKTYTKKIDVTKTNEAIKLLNKLIEEMNGLDLIVLSSGVSYRNLELKWSVEKETIDTNIRGFLAMANTAIKHFIKKGRGHLVGISSIAGLRCSGRSTAYCASKAFVSHYMKGLRAKFRKKRLNILITDIIPGFVDTPLVKDRKKFWASSPQKAAKQIYHAIKLKKKQAYITKRWRLIAWAAKILPSKIKNQF